MRICTNGIRDLGVGMAVFALIGLAVYMITVPYISEEHNTALTALWIGAGILFIIVAVVVFIVNMRRSDSESKIIQRLVKYKKFMDATNQYTITAIAEEFDEPVEEIEKFIQLAIDKGILGNVYLSKKTKELLLINKKPAFSKAKINQQNVSVENNVIINDNTNK